MWSWWFNECFSADSHCDEGYLLFGEHCYHFETESVKTWQDAESYCVAQNGHLVSIHNQETISFLIGATADRMTSILEILQQRVSLLDHFAHKSSP